MKQLASHQRGVALLIVLWMSLLLTVVAGGFAYHTQVEGLLTRRAVDHVKATEAAQAALAMAVYQLKQPNPLHRPWADGRPYQLIFEDVELRLRIQDESGKISLNRSTHDQLQKLFASAGVEDTRSSALADAVLDFVDGDDLVRLHGAEAADYAAGGVIHTPKNAPFVVLEELLMVYGMDYSLYQQIAPGVTPYGDHSAPDWRLAPKTVLRAVPDMDDGFIEEFVQARFEQTTTELLPTWPDGRQLSAFAGRGPIYTIEIDATLPNNSVNRIKAVVDISKTSGPLPFGLLVWQPD